MNTRSIASLLLLALLVFASSFPAFAAVDEPEEIRFGIVDWPGVTQKTYVAGKILEHLGYDVTVNTYSQPILLRGLGSAELDVFLGLWIPSARSYAEPYYEEGSVERLTVNLDETLYRPAVPTYVYDEGVHEIGDLDRFAEQFGSNYYGIEPGNDGNEIMWQAIEDNTYNLAGWTVVESSEVAMLANVRRMTEQGDWIVFSAWTPHWMNVAYDIRYLEDPEGIWGDSDRVDTIVRTGFAEEFPNAAAFLERFQVTSEIQSEWIVEYGLNERDPEEVAEEWIKDNIRVVEQWVYGVTHRDGERARDAIRAAMGL